MSILWGNNTLNKEILIIKIILTIILAIIFIAMLFTKRGWRENQKSFEGAWRSSFNKDGSWKKYGNLIYGLWFLIPILVLWFVL